MWASMMRRTAGALATAAVALALTGAPGGALARSGGGHSGAYQRGGVHSTNSLGAGYRRYTGSIRTGGRFHDHDGARDRLADDHDHDLRSSGSIFGRDPGYQGEHWGGFLAGNGVAGFPVLSLFHRYGDGDGQPCLRRDVYGDLYPAC